MPYRTFEDLQSLIRERITRGGLDAVIHCAPYERLSGRRHLRARPRARIFSRKTDAGQATERQGRGLVDRAAGKVKSDEPELWLRFMCDSEADELLLSAAIGASAVCW